MGRKRAMVRLRPILVIAAAAACGVVLATTMVAVAATNVSVSPRDNCGGFNGHVVWSGGGGPYIQLYGEVWDTTCSGSTYVWLSWDSPTYHNVQADGATEPNTVGVNYKTTTSATPDNIKVTVCSTYGGWHCGTPVAVPPPSTSPPTTTATTPSPPVTTKPVPVTVPGPGRAGSGKGALRVRLTMTWTWDRAITQLRRVKIGAFPVGTSLRVRCLGRGCPWPAKSSASGRRGVHRLLRRLEGRLYSAGDRLMISLQASGWLPERAEIRIRSGRVPKAKLLGS